MASKVCVCLCYADRLGVTVEALVEAIISGLDYNIVQLKFKMCVCVCVLDA